MTLTWPKAFSWVLWEDYRKFFYSLLAWLAVFSFLWVIRNCDLTLINEGEALSPTVFAFWERVGGWVLWGNWIMPLPSPTPLDCTMAGFQLEILWPLHVPTLDPCYYMSESYAWTWERTGLRVKGVGKYGRTREGKKSVTILTKSNAIQKVTSGSRGRLLIPAEPRDTLYCTN